MSKGLRLLVAAVLGILAAITALAYLAGREGQIMQAQEVKKIFVASEDIRQGTAIDKSKITVRDVPEAYVQPGAATKADEILGRVARTDILRNEQILETKLSKVSSDNLSQLILPEDEMRAVTFPVDAVASVAGLIKPGDRVDVLGFFEVNHDGERLTELRVLEQAMLILAVDQDTQTGGTPDKAGAGQSQSGVGLVTVLARANIAQRLLLAQRVGRITLMLRRAGDVARIELPIMDQSVLLGGRAMWRESGESHMLPPSMTGGGK